MVCELSYVNKATGETVVEEVEGFKEACERAKGLAANAGRRVTIKKRPVPQWYLVTVDLSDGSVVRREIAMTKLEAAKFWLHWEAKKHQVLCVMWPGWAPDPKLTIEA